MKKLKKLDSSLMFRIYNVSNCYIRIRHTFLGWDELAKNSRYSLSGF